MHRCASAHTEDTLSYLLEMLGRGLDHEAGDLLDRYYWAPQSRSLAELETTCREHPDWPDMQLHRGLALLRAMQVPEAIEAFMQACRAKSDYLAARLALAASLVESGQCERALEHLTIANTFKPGEAPVLFGIGFVLEKLGRGDDACDYYRDALAADKNLRAARERLAAIAVAKGNLAAAIEQYKQLREDYPQENWIRSALAQLYFRDAQYTQAVEEYESAIAMEPENWALQDDEVEALVAAGQLREAIERLQVLLEEQGPLPDLHVRLGDLFGKAGDDAAAVKHYQAALELSPTYMEAMVKLGTQHLITARWDEAAEAFHRASMVNENALASYIGLGVAQEAAGNREAALNSFDLAGAVEPNSTLLLAEVARLQLKAALADEFCKAFEAGDELPVAEVELDNDDLLDKQADRHAEQVHLHGDHADLRYQYGVLLRAQGRLAEAMEQFSAAVELNGSYVQAIVKLGLTQQEMGQIEQAIETFKQALDLKPQYVDLHYRLGLLYTDRREFEQAAQHMEAAATGSPHNEQVRAGLALALQNLGLMDKTAAAWRGLWKVYQAAAKPR